jgi:subtilase family serine protease
MRRTFSRTILVLCASLAVATTLSLRAQSSRATLTGSVPSWATSSRFKAHADTTSYVGFRLYLGWQNAAEAESRARAVSDPRSSSYGRYLTPAQFRQSYSPSQSSTNSVRSWLQSQGFSIVDVPSNNHYVAAEGTVAQAETAFATTLNMYTVNGLTLRSPAAPLSVPSSLANAVVAVVGLDQSDQFLHTDRADAPAADAFVNAPPCSIYWASAVTTNLPQAYQQTSFPDVPCGYTPSQLQGAYGVDANITSGNDGSGQTVAIIDAYASPTIVNDVNTYSSLHGLPALKPGQFKQVVAPGTFHHPEAGLKQDPQGWYGEETLDVEAVHTMAPGANIVFVGAPNDRRDLDAALNHVIDKGLAQIITNSYGYPTELVPPGLVKPINDSLIQAAIEGIGVYFSSGDDGDEVANIGFRSVDWPAASPWVTAVGGTTLAVTAGNNYLFETGWGTMKSVLTGNQWDPKPPGNFIYASGGGTSWLFPQPFYQVGVVPSAISGYFGGSGRAVPDVAMVGDPNSGMLEGQTQTFPDGSVQYGEYRIGGTSLSSPLFAGLMALADQAAGHPHGFANPALYAAAAFAGYHDIVNPPSTVAVVRVDFNNSVDASGGTSTSLRTANQTGTLHTIAGYDDVTGVGTPIGAALIQLLSQ